MHSGYLVTWLYENISTDICREESSGSEVGESDGDISDPESQAEAVSRAAGRGAGRAVESGREVGKRGAAKLGSNIVCTSCHKVRESCFIPIPYFNNNPCTLATGFA